MRADESGRTIGSYRLVREIGRGAMASVYEAQQVNLRRSVAVKILHANFAGEAKAVRRFLREAEASGSLRHPGIVTVHDRGQENGFPFLVMELVDGPTLADVVRDMRGSSSEIESQASTPSGLPGPDTPARERIDFAVEIGIQVADALQHAHERGVVHRDVKPGNILLRDGKALISDFGLAEVAWGSQLTATGEILGTPAYMSPEQARSEETDARTDVYSLGATLYELITLRRPVEGRSLQDYFQRIPVDEPEPIRKLEAAASRDLETILLRAMAKDSERRYRSAAELADDLRSLQNDGPIRARPDGLVRKAARRARRRPRLTLAIAAILVAAVTATLLVLAWPEDPTISRLRVRAAGGGAVPVRLVPTDDWSFPLWDQARDLGRTGDDSWIVPTGDHWVVVGGEDAFVEFTLTVPMGETVDIEARLVPQAEVKKTDMVKIEGGVYDIPAVLGDVQFGSRRVRPFLIDRTEVSVGEFIRYLRESGRTFSRWKKEFPPASEHPLPMTRVSWYDAAAYAAWVGKRLPTTDEWLVAFYGRDGVPPPGANEGPEAPAMPVDEPGEDRSSFGVFHLRGNASEWTRTWHVSVKTASDGTRSVERGGRYVLGTNHRARAGSVSDRFPVAVSTSPPGAESYGRGFRCAKSLTAR